MPGVMRMAKVTKTQARKRLLESFTKIDVAMRSPHVSASCRTKLFKIQNELAKIANSMK